MDTNKQLEGPVPAKSAIFAQTQKGKIRLARPYPPSKERIAENRANSFYEAVMA